MLAVCSIYCFLTLLPTWICEIATLLWSCKLILLCALELHSFVFLPIFKVQN
jgi:hypothetical protein